MGRRRSRRSRRTPSRRVRAHTHRATRRKDRAATRSPSPARPVGAPRAERAGVDGDAALQTDTCDRPLACSKASIGRVVAPPARRHHHGVVAEDHDPPRQDHVGDDLLGHHQGAREGGALQPAETPGARRGARASTRIRRPLGSASPAAGAGRDRKGTPFCDEERAGVGEAGPPFGGRLGGEERTGSRPEGAGPERIVSSSSSTSSQKRMRSETGSLLFLPRRGWLAH